MVDLYAKQPPTTPLTSDQSGQPKDNDAFHESLRILFWYGQLPIIAFSFIAILVVASYYRSPIFIEAALVLGFALVSVLFSLAAVSWKKNESFAVVLLVISLLVTVFYLHFLVDITGGRHSTFLHLYLYLPAVVLMVARKRRWAEILCCIAVFLSYCVNYSSNPNWGAWTTFGDTKLFKYFEPIFVLSLLGWLTAVNARMENIPKSNT